MALHNTEILYWNGSDQQLSPLRMSPLSHPIFEVEYPVV